MPSVLILGGVGFVGRNLARYLVENKLSSDIRVVDKVLPTTAWFSPATKVAFESIDFKQANLIKEDSCQKCFQRDDGGSWDIVINLAAETKYSQTPAIYKEKVLELSKTVGARAAKSNCKVFIEVSTAQVYDADKKPSNEEARVKPWTQVAKFKLEAENELKKISGLNLLIVRPAIIYGISDTQGLTPRLIMGSVYKKLGEEMKLLWTKDLRMNTVHVEDVCRALWHLGTHYADKDAHGEVYNLADKQNTDQGTINKHIASIFGIETGFQGTLISNFAKLNIGSVTEDVNDKHLQPWSELLKESGILNSPLTPYLDQELLYNNSLSVDGSKIEETGFSYSVPHVTEEKLREVIDTYKEMGIWPK